MGTISRALISVYDKTGIIELAALLAKKGVSAICTTGTQKLLDKNGIKTADIGSAGGAGDLFAGAIRTMHPAILASLMVKPGDAAALEQLKNMGGEPISLLVVNPLPIESPENAPRGKGAKAFDSMDIGALNLIRAALRNADNVVILSNPAQYEGFMAAFADGNGSITESLRNKLALQAAELLAEYDIGIYQHFNNLAGGGEFLADTLFLRYKKQLPLKYGENPHQKAAFFRRPEFEGVSLCDLEQINGPELSYNNLNDLNTALEIALEFDHDMAVIVKHGNPVSVAMEKDAHTSFVKAKESDRISSFGAVVAFNCQVDKKTAKEIETAYTEVLMAVKFTDGALDVLRSSKKTANMKILKINSKKWAKPAKTICVKSVLGGVIVQENDNLLVPEDGQIKMASKRKPTRKQLADLVLAWKVCKYVRSNAIVIVKDGRTLGIGAGQMSRLDAMKIAIEKAGEEVVGAVMASDAYFPFRNVIDEAAQSGISAIIQPGGARRDDEIVMACDEHNVALCLTGMRHFKH